jgi:hypothetical protein
MAVMDASPVIEVPLSEALEAVEILAAEETVQSVTRFRIDYEVGEIVEYVTDEITVDYLGTGEFETRLKGDHWFDDVAGKVYRNRTLADVQIEPVPEPELPQWIVDRLPPGE